MALTKDDLRSIGGVMEEKLRPVDHRLGVLEGRMNEHVRQNGVAAKKGLIAGIGGWLHGLRGWQRVVAIGILGAVVLGVVHAAGGRLPGLS